ncbi:MAG: hypothetical protein IJT56_10575 [Clostridia bacterium]|nr:hypothetical protein [Clostridia bacterium]
MITRKTRFDRSKLLIGAYCIAPYARDEAHVRDMKECGIDFLTAAPWDKELLDNCQKYGIGVVTTGVIPGWWGGDGDNAGQFAEKVPLEKIKEGADKYVDHPAVWGIDSGDEPSALDYEHYGKVIAYAEQLFPDKLIYLNLYPNYASVAENNGSEVVSQLGTKTYQEYIDQYVEKVNTDYICLDNYEFSAGTAKFYDNLRIVAQACLDSGRDFWFVIQVNSSKPDIWLNKPMLRHQAFTALAFGAVSLNWACWTAGWWHNEVLDKDGNKTEQYEKLKKVNSELRTLEPYYMAYKNVSFAFAGSKSDAAVESSGVPFLPSWSNEIFSGVTPGDGENICVGFMRKREGKGYALMISDVTNPACVDDGSVRTVRFQADPKYKISVVNSDTQYGLKYENGVYTVTLDNCGGAMIIAE